MPFQDAPLFYWHREARNANAEVDYVISEGADVLPIEVKAARGGALRSVFQFLGEKKRAKAILSLPLYLAGQVRRLAAEFCVRR